LNAPSLEIGPDNIDQNQQTAGNPAEKKKKLTGHVEINIIGRVNVNHAKLAQIHGNGNRSADNAKKNDQAGHHADIFFIYHFYTINAQIYPDQRPKVHEHGQANINKSLKCIAQRTLGAHEHGKIEFGSGGNSCGNAQDINHGRHPDESADTNGSGKVSCGNTNGH
jgi:hypothetical protein